jgi:hypothetical protein
MGEITKLAKATSKSDSLRTTVPSGIVKQLNLKEKDSLDWVLKVEKDNLVIVVKPIKKQ